MTMTTRREAILKEMGLAPLWKRRASTPELSTEQTTPPTDVPSLPQDGKTATVHLPKPDRDHPATTAVIPVLASPSDHLPESSATNVALQASERQARIMAMDWEALQISVSQCQACDLCKERRQAVLGVGDTRADWLIVGEGPGAEEDLRGEPFVGPAGQLLDAMLASIALARGRDVYIANAVKCRPPANRTPTAEEMQACRPYLDRQIELLQPRLILALGRPAAQTLLQQEIKIASARQRLFDYRGIPLIISYHPAYLLRSPQDKAKAWDDLCFARRQMQQLKPQV